MDLNKNFATNCSTLKNFVWKKSVGGGERGLKKSICKKSQGLNVFEPPYSSLTVVISLS